jgi:hypothetical protein
MNTLEKIIKIVGIGFAIGFGLSFFFLIFGMTTYMALDIWGDIKCQYWDGHSRGNCVLRG